MEKKVLRENLVDAYGAGGEFTKNINEAAGEGAAEIASAPIHSFTKGKYDKSVHL